MSPGPACGDKGGLCGAAQARSIGTRSGSAPGPWHLSQGTRSGHRHCCQEEAGKHYWPSLYSSPLAPECAENPFFPGHAPRWRGLSVLREAAHKGVL